MDSASNKTNCRVYPPTNRVTALALWRALFTVPQLPQDEFLSPWSFLVFSPEVKQCRSLLPEMWEEKNRKG